MKAASHARKPPPTPAPALRHPLAGLDHDIADRLAAIAERSGRDIADVREYYEERAAIRQYAGKQDRGAAELDAAGDCEALVKQGRLL